jgi:hypothetical protein
MKTRTIWFLLLAAALVTAFWFSGSLSATEKKVIARDKNVVMVKKENGKEFILPGTTMSTADAEAMNRILNQYDKTLFRIDTYEKGKRKKARGTLTDVITDKRLASELTAAVNEGFSQYAIRIHTVATDPTKSPTPKSSKMGPVPGPSTDPTKSNTAPVPSPGTNPTRSNQNSAKTKELSDRLEQILKKYQRK